MRIIAVSALKAFWDRPGRKDTEEPLRVWVAIVSEVLTRKRAMTLPMIRALSKLLDIPADILIQPYETRSAA
ncbi:MAG TPA: hypothetical protein VFA50_01615 [Stellaceae bacterium]|nr:hypothetical protein [Stellaceae bacterium]